MNELQKLASSLHVLMCEKKHLYNPEEISSAKEECCFYAEDSLVDCWNLEDHKKWLKEAKTFVYAVGLNPELAKDIRKATFVLARIREIGSQVAFFMNNHPGASVYLARIISLYASGVPGGNP